MHQNVVQKILTHSSVTLCVDVKFSCYSSCFLYPAYMLVLIQHEELVLCGEKSCSRVMFNSSSLSSHLCMRKVVCLFCFVLMRSTELGPFRRSWSLWKALKEEGCSGLVSWCLDLWCRSSRILNEFFAEN